MSGWAKTLYSLIYIAHTIVILPFHISLTYASKESSRDAPNANQLYKTLGAIWRHDQEVAQRLEESNSLT